MSTIFYSGIALYFLEIWRNKMLGWIFIVVYRNEKSLCWITIIQRNPEWMLGYFIILWLEEWEIECRGKIVSIQFIPKCGVSRSERAFLSLIMKIFICYEILITKASKWGIQKIKFLCVVAMRVCGELKNINNVHINLSFVLCCCKSQ